MNPEPAPVFKEMIDEAKGKSVPVIMSVAGYSYEESELLFNSLLYAYKEGVEVILTPEKNNN